MPGTTSIIEEPIAVFAPVLYVDNVAAAITFYEAAFSAIEVRRFSNDDGSVHVAEMMISGAVCHIHEPVARDNNYSPVTLHGCSVIIGLFVPDPDGMMAQALAAGAQEMSPMQDYDYGLRQGGISDPFGHHWVFQKKIG